MKTLEQVFNEHQQWCNREGFNPRECNFSQCLVNLYKILEENVNQGFIQEASAIEHMNTKVKQWKRERLINIEVLLASVHPENGKYVADPFKQRR